MIEPSFLADKEVARILGVSQSTVSRMYALDGALRGVRPVIVGSRRRWPRREIERAFGLADDEPCDSSADGCGGAHEATKEKIVGKWRAEKPKPNRWGEAVTAYAIGGAAVG